MSDLKIRSNNQARDVLRWHDLTAKEQERFDWLETEQERDDAQFFRYRGWTYCMDEFSVMADKDDAMSTWDGYAGDSYFSGVLVRLVEHGEAVIVGRYSC